MIPANPPIKFFDGDRRGYVHSLSFASFVAENGRPGAVRI
jgi:hypothetical protein